jgi:hypothetical protein
MVTNGHIYPGRDWRTVEGMTIIDRPSPPRRGLDGVGLHREPRESDSQLLLSIRNLLRTILVIWLVLLAFGGIVGYTTWQQARCEESSIYSSDC